MALKNELSVTKTPLSCSFEYFIINQAQRLMKTTINDALEMKDTIKHVFKIIYNDVTLHSLTKLIQTRSAVLVCERRRHK